MVFSDVSMAKGRCIGATSLFAILLLTWSKHRSEAYTFLPVSRCRAVLPRPAAKALGCYGQSAFKCSRRRNLVTKARAYDDEGFEEENDSTVYDTRLVGDSDAARELQEMRYEDDEEYYSDDEDDSYEAEEFEEQEPRSRYREEYDMEEEEEASDTGNFWSNPKQSFDPVIPQEQRPQRRRQSMPPSTATPHKRRPKRRSTRRSSSRTTFRSGTPSPPAALEDFFNRLFWYGFDSDDMASTSDKTVFGGTRGKFNGLEYMKQVKGEPVGRPYRQDKTPRRQPRQDRYDDDVYDDDANEFHDDDEYEANTENFDNRGRQRSESDWVSDEVSSWFVPDNSGRKEQGRRRKKDPWNVLEQMLKPEEDDEMQFKAKMYNRRVAKNRGTKDPLKQRRAGNAYPYVDDDPSPPVVDIHADDIKNSVSRSSEIRGDPATGDETDAEPPKRTWLDRAQAVERVPPRVPAWGPSGEIGLDARTKATLDALEEIRQAKRKLEVMEERVILAKENLVVVRADAELQKKRLLANKRSRMARDRLNQIEMDVDDASMALRRTRAQATVAKERLSDLEERHWALLSLYDADKAFREVVETIQESERNQVSESSSETDSVIEDGDRAVTTTEGNTSPEETKRVPDSEREIYGVDE